jgi:ferredoxin
MTHVVTDNCRGCRYTECATVCPVACFHADEEMAYIDAKVCIDCGACVPKCPVQAIYDDFDLAEDHARWVAINAERALVTPKVLRKLPPLPGAEARRLELGL